MVALFSGSLWYNFGEHGLTTPGDTPGRGDTTMARFVLSGA